MTILDKARSASADVADTRRTIEKLTGMGFGNDAFKIIHQFGTTVTSFINYSLKLESGAFDLDGNNHRVHQCLIYVLVSCPGGAPPKGKSFVSLAGEARREIPAIPTSKRRLNNPPKPEPSEVFLPEH